MRKLVSISSEKQQKSHNDIMQMKFPVIIVIETWWFAMKILRTVDTKSHVRRGYASLCVCFCQKFYQLLFIQCEKYTVWKEKFARFVAP